jgi:hypothetical protein
MRNRSALVVILLCVIALSALQANAQIPSCAGIRTIADCPDTGCGGSGADPLLNERKNRTADAASPERLTLSDIRRLRQPRRWPVGQDRSSLAANEDRAVAVMGFLNRASVSTRESTNCNLSGASNNDNHLDLISRPGDVGATAVTAEITPRVRKDGWTIEKLRFLASRNMFVRATGWLTLDTQHISSPLSRSTNWEVHPVTGFDVCTGTTRQCQQGNNWMPLEDWQIPRARRSTRRGRGNR